MPGGARCTVAASTVAGTPGHASICWIVPGSRSGRNAGFPGPCRPGKIYQTRFGLTRRVVSLCYLQPPVIGSASRAHD